MRIQFFAVLFSLLAAGTSAAQSRGVAPARQSLPATIILASEYPAFSPTHPTAIPLRAIVFLQDPSGGDTKLILLNPAHANAHTLYEALSILRRRAGAPQGGAKFVPIGLRPGVRPPASAIAARLDSILSTLKDPGARQTTLHRIQGTTAEILDVSEFSPPVPQPQRP
jgi:hypothetical protein